MFYYDSYYLILVVPCIIFALLAQASVSSTFRKYSRVSNRRGMTGAQAAYEVMRANGVMNVRIERVGGNLTDHYDPRSNVIRLSDSVYDSTSVAAVGVAAHEAGHAVQYAVNYAPIRIRMAIVPITNIGSQLSWPLILLGLVFSMQALLGLGVLCFSLSTLFQLITLPVELDASHRAIVALRDHNLLSYEELPMAKKTLRAAAMTYVAALATSIAQLLRLLLLYGGRRDDR
jgi:Zn-dependent membrane protease YugP